MIADAIATTDGDDHMTKLEEVFEQLHGRSPGMAPYGYMYDETGVLEREDEQAVLRVILQLREAGATLEEIASTLNHEGVRARRGGSWRASVVSDVLRVHQLRRGTGPVVLTGARAIDWRLTDRARSYAAQRFLRGTPFATIARELNERGIATARGARWHGNSVRRLVQRELVARVRGVQFQDGPTTLATPKIRARLRDVRQHQQAAAAEHEEAS